MTESTTRQNLQSLYRIIFNWRKTGQFIIAKALPLDLVHPPRRILGIMILDSNPKAYNLDKMLEFLASARSVFMFYFVGVEPGKIVNTVLVSMFQNRLLNATILLKHWAGRNSRGVSQFEGKTIGQLILSPETAINEETAISFLYRVLAL